MKLKSKSSLSLALICFMFSGCAPEVSDTQAQVLPPIQYAVSKPAFDVLKTLPVSYEEDYSHLVKDGRFLSGKLPIIKTKQKDKKQATDKIQYKQEGYASWYSSWFHGRKTSSGVEYDEEEYSAAHRTLPIPSVVKVINLQNKKTVTVVVNDRGPYKGGKNRIIDLSRQAAEDLDIIEKGTAKVKIEFLVEETKKLFTHLKPKEQKKAQLALNRIMH